MAGKGRERSSLPGISSPSSAEGRWGKGKKVPWIAKKFHRGSICAHPLPPKNASGDRSGERVVFHADPGLNFHIAAVTSVLPEAMIFLPAESGLPGSSVVP
ncbi:MAG: hypothetical protein D6795_00820 [Deltaproteobacteria bacterium]|nr:MAG: hypothetical protein D6795_00820 [Deltaproteobacteria bacterium]